MRRNQNLKSNLNDKNLDESNNIHIPIINDKSNQGNNSLKKIKTFQNSSHQNNKKNASESVNLDLIFSMQKMMNSKIDIMNERIYRIECSINKNKKTNNPKNLLHENNKNLLIGKKRKSESINSLKNKNNQPLNEERDIDINNNYKNIEIQLYSLNENSDNESIISNIYSNVRNVNKYKSLELNNFLNDYYDMVDNSIFYGIPKKSTIEIRNNCVYYEKPNTKKKQFIIIGKKELKMNENFNYCFHIIKKKSHVYFGLINMNLINNKKFKFHSWKSEASILFSTRKTIWNYQTKEHNGKKIKCNDIIEGDKVTFSFFSKKKKLIISYGDEKSEKLYLNVRESNFRLVIFFESEGVKMEVNKIKEIN